MFLFLTVGHGKQFNSKEAEPSNNMELSSVQVFAYLTRTRGNKGKKSSCLAGYLIYQIIKFRLIWLFRKLAWPVSSTDIDVYIKSDVNFFGDTLLFLSLV